MSCQGCNIDNMWPPYLKVQYVDQETYIGNAEDWKSLRGDGIDQVQLGRVGQAGHSFYWLYPEKLNEDEEELVWVLGATSIHAPDALERIMRENGEMFSRRRREIPDLRHDQMKLGWWRKSS